MHSLRNILMAIILLSATLAGAADKSTYPNFFINGDKVNVRENPDSKSKALAQLNRNELVIVSKVYPHYETLSGKFGCWYQIATTTGKSGWVFSPFVAYNLGPQIKNSLLFSANLYGATGEANYIGLIRDGLFLKTSPQETVRVCTDYFASNNLMTLFFNDGKKNGTIKNISIVNAAGINGDESGCTVSLNVKGDQQGAKERTTNRFPAVGGLSIFAKLNFTVSNATIPDERKILMDQATAYLKSNSSLFTTTGIVNDMKLTDGKNESVQIASDPKNKTYYYFASFTKATLETENSEDNYESVFTISKKTDKGFELMAVTPHFNDQGAEKEEFMGITDLNGDGIPEIWTFVYGYEWDYYKIYVIHNGIAVPVFEGGYSGC